MFAYDFKPRGVCARAIHISLSDDGSTIESVAFDGGCNGNLKAIAKLVDGWTVEEIVSKLAGNTCGYKDTSCADQLALAVQEAYQAQSKVG